MVLNIDRLARNVGGSSHKDYDCLEWPYEPDSAIRKLFIDVYRDFFEKEYISTALYLISIPNTGLFL